MWIKTIQQDLESFNLSLNEAIDFSESPTLETDVYVWRYALVVVKPEMNDFSCD